MAELTPKQEAFVAAYIETNNASEAYRRAYDCSRMKKEVIWTKASELLSHGAVSVRIAALRKEARQSVKITLKDHLEKLQDLRDKADGAGQFSAAIKAEENRGRASGIYSAAEEDEKELRSLSRDEILAELKSIQDVIARYGQSGS